MTKKTYPIMARLEQTEDGFVITSYGQRGNVIGIIRPFTYATIYPSQDNPGDICFQDAVGGGRYQGFGKHAQAALNAIAERKPCEFYYYETP